MGFYDRGQYPDGQGASRRDRESRGLAARHPRGRPERPAGGTIRMYGPWIVVLLLPFLFSQHRVAEDGRRSGDESPVAAGDRSTPAKSVSSAPGLSVSRPGEHDGSPPAAAQEAGPERAASELNRPATEFGTAELILEPSENGNFYAKGTINQQEILFLVDTGASWISIPERLKWKLKLNAGRYVRVTTASGVVGNYETRIDSLVLGPLQFKSVVAALNPYAPNEVVLLGMSALKDVQMIHQDGHLILRQQLRPEQQHLETEPARPSKTLSIKRSVRECMGPNLLANEQTLNCIQGD